MAGLIVPPVRRAAVRLTPEEFRDGCLRNAEHRRNLSLGVPRGVEIPGALGPTLGHGAGLVPTLAPPMRSTTIAHRADVSPTVSILCADIPVYASHRSRVACTYVGSSSTPRQRRPVFVAAMNAVPLPTKGS